MPRIRKKTSNRTKIHERAKLRKKVKDSKRKKAKEAKKNPQWKSKTKKDPGIPNDFPYKDQILAEVAEQRRLAAEEKERRKEEKRLAREQVKGNDQGEEDQSDNEESETPAIGKKDLNVGADAIASLSAKIVSSEIRARPEPESDAEEESDEEDVPALVNRDLPTLQSVLDASDVVLQVIDARDPLEYRSQHLENVAKERGLKFALVLNKIDSCPRDTVSAWLSHLRSQHPTFLFRSATAFLPPPPVPTPVSGKGKSKTPVNDALGADGLTSYLTRLAQEKEGDGQLTVAVVGVTNVGKSSVINSLTKQGSLPVYSLSTSSRSATTTELPQEVLVEVEGGKQIRIIDTPGLSFDLDRSAENKNELRGRDILLRSRGRIDKLKDPSLPITYIISRANNEDLMLMYNLAAFAKDDPTAFLSGVARSNQLVKKRGELDLAGASRVVLRDWSVGKFARYATPPKAQSGTTRTPEEWLAALYSKGDEAVSATLRSRKELRKTAGLGLVRFSPGALDGRRVNIEDEWTVLDQVHEDDGGEFGMEVDGDSGSDVDEEDDDADEEDDDDADEEDEDDEVGEDSSPDMDGEEEVEIPVTEMKKRKRGMNPPLQTRPVKKVAFGSTKGKQASSRTQKKDKATSSILKKQEPRVTKKPPARPVKVANVHSSNKTKATDGGSEAYDFSKFF